MTVLLDNAKALNTIFTSKHIQFFYWFTIDNRDIKEQTKRNIEALNQES